jgi:hypothetical protein
MCINTKNNKDKRLGCPKHFTGRKGGNQLLYVQYTESLPYVRSGKLDLNRRFHEIDRFFCLLLNIYKILGSDFQLDLLGMQLLAPH